MSRARRAKVALVPFIVFAALPARAQTTPWPAVADQMIGRAPLSISVAVDGQPVYAHAGGIRRAPASNEKLLLSMALLDRFGAGYRIPTTVEGSCDAKGACGNLWLVGHGDPGLEVADL